MHHDSLSQFPPSANKALLSHIIGLFYYKECSIVQQCQLTVANASQPVRKARPHVLMYHYMDGMLIAAEQEEVLKGALLLVQQAVHSVGLQIGEEKV